MKKVFLSILILCGFGASLKAQVILQDTAARAITTAIPFLLVTPDARSAAMGDAGVAISADPNSVYWNPAKLAFADAKYGVSLSYNPWLRNLVNDMWLSLLSGYYKIDDKQAFGLDFRYFNLGDINFTDVNGAPIRDFQMRELGIALMYSRKLSKQFGVSVGARYVNSNLTGEFAGGGANQAESKPGNTIAADLAFYYTNDKLKISGKPAQLSFGLNISNIGAKISYTDQSQADFIPTNFRLGSALTMNLDPLGKNKITFALDANKLMVPSPPLRDGQGNIIRGTNPRDISLISGILGSFSDAPDGGKEELQEISIATGLEYSYNDFLMLRAGYFHEHKLKGNRRHFTVGAGFRKGSLGFDFAYLIPVQVNNPLAETLRFTVMLNFKDKKKVQTFDGTEEN